MCIEGEGACKIIDKAQLKVCGGCGVREGGRMRVCGGVFRCMGGDVVVGGCGRRCEAWQRSALVPSPPGVPYHLPPHRPTPPPLTPPPVPLTTWAHPHHLCQQDPKDRDRVDRECRVMRHLSNHTAIVRLLEHVETPGYVYIMMEAARRG